MACSGKFVANLRRLVLSGVITLPLSGCALMNRSAERDHGSDSGWPNILSRNRDTETAPPTDERISNPPARTIRFDGHEIVLGNGEATTLAPSELLERVRSLQKESRLRSAAAYSLQHADAAERLLIERWATSDESAIRAIADAQSWRSQAAPEGSWNSLLALAQRNPEGCRQYMRIRSEFATALQDHDPEPAMVSALRQAAEGVNHSLIDIDVLRLMGLRDLLAGRSEESRQHYQQAVQKAESIGNLAEAAELGLMVAEAARRQEDFAQAAAAWKAAVGRHLTVMSREGVPVDPNFWRRADHLRPEDVPWPNELAMVLALHCRPIGCRTAIGTAGVSAEMVLWAAVGWAQFERGQPQLALVSLKESEVSAEALDAPWLRIAQAKCLTALGQFPAATAVLSGPVASENPSVAAAATAALGSVKLKAGAFQQGASLLNKAIATAPEADWPGRGRAQADLALAQLIIGETDQGLDALHQTQTWFADRGDWASVIRTLENEAKLLEHENRASEATAIRDRIARMEQL